MMLPGRGMLRRVLAALSISFMRNGKQIACLGFLLTRTLQKEGKKRAMTPSISKLMSRTATASAIAALLASTLQLPSAHAQSQSFGDRLYHDKADCQFCHGVNGDGHGDPRSPGKAPDLHKTRLEIGRAHV